MPTRSSNGREFASNALRVVEQTIGKKMDGSPLPDPNEGKNAAAVPHRRLQHAGKRKAPAIRRGKVFQHKLFRVAKRFLLQPYFFSISSIHMSSKWRAFFRLSTPCLNGARAKYCSTAIKQ